MVPLQIFISVQSGRQYLMAYSRQFKRITSFRLDHMLSVKIEKEDQDFEELRKKLEHMGCQYNFKVGREDGDGRVSCSL